MTTRTEKVMTVATVFIAVATVASAYFIRLTDQTTRSANRAFVYFDLVKLRPYPDPPGAPNVYGVEIVVTNSGNTPAHQFRFKSACPHPAKDEAPFNSVNQDKTKVEPPMILGPKQTLSLQACNLSLDEISRTRKGEIMTFIVAEARYIDAFDVPRVTQIVQRLQFDKEGGHSFAYVGPHNCSDEDCPKSLGRSSPSN